jgi:hypothetical protein
VVWIERVDREPRQMDDYCLPNEEQTAKKLTYGSTVHYTRQASAKASNVVLTCTPNVIPPGTRTTTTISSDLPSRPMERGLERELFTHHSRHSLYQSLSTAELAGINRLAALFLFASLVERGQELCAQSTGPLFVCCVRTRDETFGESVVEYHHAAGTSC